MFVQGQRRLFTESLKAEAQKAMEALANEGERVIGIAFAVHNEAADKLNLDVHHCFFLRKNVKYF